MSQKLSTTPYDELDAAIVERIRSGFARFYEIWPPLTSLANKHVRPGSYNGADRVVDRRLQALRKRGKITCQGQKWYVL